MYELFAICLCTSCLSCLCCFMTGAMCAVPKMMEYTRNRCHKDCKGMSKSKSQSDKLKCPAEKPKKTKCPTENKQKCPVEKPKPERPKECDKPSSVVDKKKPKCPAKTPNPCKGPSEVQGCRAASIQCEPQSHCSCCNMRYSDACAK